MNSQRWSLLLCLGILVCVAREAGGQQQVPTPHIGYVYPAGGRPGETVEVKVGGQFLQNPSGAYLSRQGLVATLGEYSRPLTQKEVTDITQKLQDAQRKLGLPRLNTLPALARAAKEAGVTEEEIRGIMRFRESRTDPKKLIFPQIAETVSLRIQIDPGTPTGVYDLRLQTGLGLTNPVRFTVGSLPEILESEPNDGLPQDIGARLPSVLNGQIMPGDVDRYSISARKGARLVIVAAARDLMPYLADAVPGWFQAALTLYDAKGNVLGYADHYLTDPNPILFCEIPADGKYTIEIRDALYRGREDFVYRLTVGEIPYITTLFPLGGPSDSRTSVKAMGWNLPGGYLKMRVQPGASSVCYAEGKVVSNTRPFLSESLPDVMEKEPNDTRAKAQAVVLPVVVDGRIDTSGDQDMYKFRAHAGDKVVAEVMARRVGSPLDSVLALTDAQGKQIAFNDDFDDKGAGLITHQSDSYLVTTLPGDGVYFLHVGDAQHNGGSAYAYRLRVSAPRPDYELVTAPSSITARAGMTVAFTAYVLRRDGYAGDVALKLKDAPAGFSMSGGLIPGSIDRLRLTLTAPPNPSAQPVRIRIVGSALVQGREVVREATPADDMMQAFAYRHLVPANDFAVAVIGRVNRGVAWVTHESPIRIPVGGTVQVRLGGPAGPLGNRVQLSMGDAPEGITVETAGGGPSGFTAVFRADPAKVKLGTKGNLIIDAFTEQTTTQPQTKRTVTRRVPLGTVPAIPFEIVRP